MTKEEMLRGMIDEYRKRIETYQAMILEWEREIGAPIGSAATRSDSASTPNGKPAAGDPMTLVRDWQFFNKSQPDATQLLLETVGHPLATSKIVECLEKGGVKIGGNSDAIKKQNLYTILARSGRFGRAAKDTWGLPNWPGVTPVKMKRGDEKAGGVDEDGQKENAQ